MSSEIETTFLTLKLLQQALSQSIAETHQSPQDIQYLSTAYTSTLTGHGIEISLAHRRCPWETFIGKKPIRTLKEKEIDLNDCLK
ncbi:MAG: hypothetical protein OXM61_25240 [Candidatus Poribacteria bacterium]|nr:hypothetical protein [Candidatus Poribacteria bacterium]